MSATKLKSKDEVSKSIEFECLGDDIQEMIINYNHVINSSLHEELPIKDTETHMPALIKMLWICKQQVSNYS